MNVPFVSNCNNVIGCFDVALQFCELLRSSVTRLGTNYNMSISLHWLISWEGNALWTKNSIIREQNVTSVFEHEKKLYHQNILVEYFPRVDSYFFHSPMYSDTFLIFQKKDILKGFDAIIFYSNYMLKSKMGSAKYLKYCKLYTKSANPRSKRTFFEQRSCL